MDQALRCGVSVAQFWEMTPAETFMAIEAALWREERQWRQDVTRAWLTAALTRARWLPRLEQLLASEPKRLSGEELARRQQEFREMTENLDIETLNRARGGK